jgi:hypothetical protein
MRRGAKPREPFRPEQQQVTLNSHNQQQINRDVAF